MSDERTDETTADNEGATPPADAAAADRATFLATVRELADGIRDAHKPAPIAAPVAQAPTVDVAGERDRIKTGYQKLMEEGKYADAAEYLVNEQNDLARRLQVPSDPTSAPAYKALLSSARRAVRTDNPDLFSEYSEEIESEVALLPAAERINPDSWTSVIERVRGRHFNELVAKEHSKRTAAGPDDDDAAGARRSTRPPSTTDVRSASRRIVPLDDDAKRVAAAAGMTEDEFRKASAKYDENTINTGFCRGMVKVCADVVQPGKF